MVETSPDFGPALEQGQVGEMERHAQLKAHGINRRIALALLTRSKAQLAESLDSDPEAFVTFAEQRENLEGYISHLRAVLEFMECAAARLDMVLGDFMRQHPELQSSGETVQ
ncbi:MAG TPA: hypothetical protein VF171_00675 [Trueperaceae bacterium]